MKKRALAFLAVLGLLAPGVWADDSVQAEVLRGYMYHAPQPARIAVPVLSATATPAESGADSDTIVHLAALQVNGKPDETYHDLNAAVAGAARGAPCDLIVQNSGRFQFRAFGPPIPPMLCETRVEQLPAQFPLVTLAW